MTQFVEVFVVFALLLAVLFWRNHGFHTCRNCIGQDVICVRLLSQAKIGKQRVKEETGNSREMTLFPVSSSIRHFPVFVRRSNKRACYPRFLSPCPLKDGTFPNHFKSQKTQFLQLFRPLSPIALPARCLVVFLFQRHSSRTNSHSTSRPFSQLSALSGGTYGEI